MDLTYPSDLSPLPAAVRLRLADGWEPRPHATAAAFAIDTRSPDGFTTNLLILVTRVLADVTLDDLVDASHASPGAATLNPTVVGRQKDTIGGHEAILSVLTLQDRKVPLPLFQTQAALLVPRGEQIRDLVHCYATCPTALSERYAKTFRAMFATLTVA